MNRREMLLSMAGGFSAALLGTPEPFFGAEAKRKTGLGLCIYCLGNRSGAERARGRDFAEPLNFLESCHALGAGGIQVPLGTRDEAYSARLRGKAESLGMFIEGIGGLPGSAGDVPRFEKELLTAKRAGTLAVRMVLMPGRRYERFESAEEFRTYRNRGRKSLELAEPVAARHKVRLAVENHKDQRVPELLEIIRGLSSEFVGICVDTGNSFALLEDPFHVIEAYAPWALSVHLKDQAVREYGEGFLFADAALGEGFLDLKKMVRILREARPEVRFSLETITRDPLKVPCLKEKYWATLKDVPARDLARTLQIVRAHEAEKLPRLAGLSLEEQVREEDGNVRRSLAYARDELGL